MWHGVNVFFWYYHSNIFNYSYTKLGYAGNSEPQFIIPSAIAIKDANIAKSAVGKIPDLDFFTGDEALSAANYFVKVSFLLTIYKIFLFLINKYPVRHGIVDDWDLMERFWEHCIFKYLRAEPEDHYFLLVYNT